MYFYLNIFIRRDGKMFFLFSNTIGHDQCPKGFMIDLIIPDHIWSPHDIPRMIRYYLYLYTSKYSSCMIKYLYSLMQWIALCISKLIRSVITDKYTGSWKYIWIFFIQTMVSFQQEVSCQLHYILLSVFSSMLFFIFR